MSMERFDYCRSCGTPHRWRALFQGRVVRTSYDPATILRVQRALRLGMPRDAIVRATGVWYFSLNYVNQLKPLLTIEQRKALERSL